MDADDFLIQIFLGMTVGLMAYAGYEGLTGPRYSSFRRTDDVQAEYAKTSKLEIKLEDLDGNGKKETIFCYNGQNYLALEDKSGELKVTKYQVVPAKIMNGEESK